MTGEPTMAALLPITGTVSVGFDGMESRAVGAFSVPVTATLDAETGLMHVEGAADSAIVFAMIAALQGAADELLATVQPATVETIATCSTCGAQLGVQDASTTLEHGLDGGHIENRRLCP